MKPDNSTLTNIHGGFIVVFRSDDDEDYELSDDQIDKLLIVTQNYQSNRPPKHEGHDRTAKWTSRVKMSQELEQVINDGLYYYEEDLWLQHEQKVIIIIIIILFTLTVCLYHNFIFLDTFWKS